MLRGSLYKINTFFLSDGSLQADLAINEEHEIFNGHFPGQPVLPGACMLQIVKEVFEYVLKRELNLQKAGNVKFLQLIDPQLNNVIDLNISFKYIEDNSIQASATLTSGETVCFKFQGTFAVQKLPL